ncbi:MAG: outer membrane protein assembly factor BamD [Bacteroidales bacterium]|nr:outer membrane protein assembly factor BamD [Bacteroidales bacterium]
MKWVKIIALFSAIGLLATSCNGYEKLLNSNDYDAKYEAAMRYYNSGGYTKAARLFENLTLHYRGRDNAEQVAWCYAQTLYKQQEYYAAAYQFKRFASQFPYSENAEEGLYMSAYCKYMAAPAYTLDQSLTREAVEEFESFAERWPRSVHMPDVNRCLDEMYEKLMKKDFEIARGYYVIEEYHAAYEQMRRFIDLYPDSPFREEAMYYQLLAGYRYAKGSREDKKRERLQQVVGDFDKYSASIKDPARLASAQEIYTKTRAALAAL